jgi:hypothetical protein
VHTVEVQFRMLEQSTLITKRGSER